MESDAPWQVAKPLWIVARSAKLRMDPLTKIIQFALSVLLGGDGSCDNSHSKLIHYGRIEDAPDSAKLIILSSGFLQAVIGGDGGWVPEIPLAEHEGLPVLFGAPGVKRKDRLILEIDVIAGAFFLLTRYEELLRPDVRDEHGRFPGRESLAGRGGFSDRPLVDEYGALLRGLLREIGVDAADPPQEIRHINLTHDIDRPLVWHRWRHAAGECLRRVGRFQLLAAPIPLLNYFGVIRSDPHDTFGWLTAQNGKLVAALGKDRVSIIYFVMTGGTSEKDARYEVRSPLIRSLLRRLEGSGAKLGLHPSYEAGMKPELIEQEAQTLREIVEGKVDSSRHHYLCWREISDYHALIKAGLTHDFTMGFSDLAGFRLGIARSFLWFDPIEYNLTELRVHPISFEEGTLDRKERMNLNYDQAIEHCRKLIATTTRFHGELTLLWHNSEVTDGAVARGRYHKKLYSALLTELSTHAQREDHS